MKTSKATVAVSTHTPYGYAVVDGVEYYGRFEYNHMARDYVFHPCGRYIAVVSRAKAFDGEEQNVQTLVTIEYEDLDGQRHQVDVPRGLLAKPRDLQEKLLALGADVYSSNISVLLGCLRESEQAVSSVKNIHRKTGWLQCSDGANSLAFKGKKLIAKTRAGSKSTYDGLYDLHTRGSFSQWRDLIQDHVLGHTPLEVAVLIGLSPLLSSLCGARNLIFHLMGDSSKGKTTSAQLVVSVAGCPNPTETARRKNMMGETLRPLLSSWNGTVNAHLKKLQGLDGTIMVFDELSKLVDTKALASVIYAISDGADKDRMSSLSSLQAIDTFRTNILSIGEESLLDKAGSENTGLRMRVCEIQADFTRDAEQAEAITAGCFENYGFAAARMAAFMVRKMDSDSIRRIYQQHLTDYEKALVSAGVQSVSSRRLAEFGAILLATAEIAEKALDLKFSIATISQFLVSQQKNSGHNMSLGHRAHAALQSYLSQNIAHFVVGKAGPWNKSIPCFGRITPNKCGTGNEVSFDKNSFKAILTSLGFNNSTLVLQSFKSMGYLNHEAGKLDRKRTINTQWGQTRVFSVIFPCPDMPSAFGT